MVQPLLSAALIVRDEASMLGPCLESIERLVDEIVVVDTGSVDETPAIAARFGARVVHHPWHDDFAEARNVSLDASKGQWILYIDADERVVSGDRAYVETLLTDSSEVAFRLLLKPTLGSTPYREYRLWRHDERIRFEGVIHEKVVPAIHRLADDEGRGIGLADIVLQHVGYEGDQTHKHLRNLPLLRRQLAAEPENLFVRHHLARVLEGLGRTDEADRVLERAVAIARADSFEDPLGVLVLADLIRRRRQELSDVTSLLTEALSAYPTNCVLLFHEGEDLMAKGDYEQAIDRFDRLLRVDPSSLPVDGPAYEERLLGEVALERRALALFRSGRYAEAAESYGAAAALVPSNPAYQVKWQLAQARAQRVGVRSTRTKGGS
jgi:glycosyltransferase involved in cell wall biosynthesis